MVLVLEVWQTQGFENEKRCFLGPKHSRGDNDHSALISAYHHDLEKVSENLKDGKSIFSGQGCLTCRTVLGFRSRSRLKHRKVKHRQKHSTLNLCRKMSTICWSQSVFHWMKKPYNKSAAVPIQRQPSM